MTKRASLAEFASAHVVKTGATAWITTIPEWDEVSAAYQNGVRLTVIRQWLVDECGYEQSVATYQRIAHLSRCFGSRRA
jgi:hypothetical protein